MISNNDKKALNKSNRGINRKNKGAKYFNNLFSQVKRKKPILITNMAPI